MVTDQQELNSIGHEIIDLLKMYGIESEEFGITIHVSKEYYKSIEKNFIMFIQIQALYLPRAVHGP